MDRAIHLPPTLGYAPRRLEEGEFSPTSVKYVIDTNVIRDLSARSNDVEAQKHQKQCQHFWKKIKEDSNAILMIPEEVKVELDVQLLAEIPPKPNERQRILDAVNDCQIVYEKSTREIENKLRELSAILKAKYGSRIHEECQLTPQHMQVSDARILSAAYEQDAILVTRNSKDFILSKLSENTPTSKR